MDRQLVWVFKHKVTGSTVFATDGAEFSRLNSDYDCLGLGAVNWQVNDFKDSPTNSAIRAVKSGNLSDPEVWERITHQVKKENGGNEQ